MVNLIQVWTLVHSIFYEFSQIITFKKFHHVAPSHFPILLGLSEKCDENTNYKSDKKVALTASTWHGASPDFCGPFTAHACGNWLWFPCHLSTPPWLHLVMYMPSSGSYVPFPKYTGFTQFGKWAENIKLNAWLAICHFRGLVLTFIHTDITGHGPFSLWGVP